MLKSYLQKQCILGTLLFLLVATSCQPDKEELKKQYAKTCNDQADANMPPGEMQAVMHEFCDCCAEQMIETYSNSELKKFSKMEREGKKEDVAKTIGVTIEPCTKVLQKKMQDMDTTLFPLPSPAE